MNKKQFIKALAEKANFTQKDAGLAFEAFAATIADTLKSGEKISIDGFGTFELKKKEAKQGINPKTKEKIMIPAGVTPVFKFGQSFKNLVVEKE